MIKGRTNGPFVVRSTLEVYASPWLSVREDAVVRPGGDAGRFAVVTMQPGSSVLAVDSDGRVLLAWEHKYAIEQETLELISGALEAGETPQSGAERELQEEAGVRARRWTSLGVVNPFTTSINSPNYVFLARDLEAAVRLPRRG